MKHVKVDMEVKGDTNACECRIDQWWTVLHSKLHDLRYPEVFTGVVNTEVARVDTAISRVYL